MKKQNKNQASSNWIKIPPKHQILWVVGFFMVGMLICWWYIFNIISWQVKSFEFFIDFSGQSVITKGQGAATTQEQEADPYRLIDGVLVDDDKDRFWPYAVMMENLLSVRPQSGLSQAAVVYESLVEGGATRFMAVYDPSEIIPEIMPVRSARPYYLEWSSEYGAMYAHAGGSPKALTVIRENPDIIDLEALSSDAKYFWRDTSKSAPHNLVTSSEKMNFALYDKKLIDKEAEIKSWKFKDEAELEERGEDGKKASFNFSYGLTYKVDFQYNQGKNSYLRFNADQPFLDKNTGEQIEAKNVIVQLVEEPVFDGGKGRLEIFVGGEGVAWFFRDGQAIPATWKKESRTDRTLFYDIDGNEIEFNRGNAWIHIIPKDKEVLYE
ncbi:DUF3048 domain-containing protein [Patescibacteria group bacterium]|nr:DUF3048 domain-containing protein [Patescibacteria group bacterium]MBU0963743.1 DUF3048 domain-containing protein [Patescibacteria group bacterium]